MFKSILNIFLKKNKNDSADNKAILPVEAIDLELSKQLENIEDKNSFEDKYFIYRKILYLLMRKKVIRSKSSYIVNAFNYFKDEYFEDNLYKALRFLNKIDINKLSKEYIYEIFSFKALIYEALEDFNESTACYKELIRLTNSEDAVKEFKEYVQRYNKLLNWQKNEKNKVILDELYTLHNKTPLEDLPKSVKSLENIALYYIKSPKSRSVGKRYFKEVLKIYKRLYEYNPKEYSCDYIKALLDGVELFMLSPILLKDAQELLEKDNMCIKSRVYLIERLKELKHKNFIKKTISSFYE